MKFKAYFDVSRFTVIPDTFIDNEMWIEFNADDFSDASHIAFAQFIKTFLVEAPDTNMPVIRSIELLKIIDAKGAVKHFTRI